MTYTKSSWKCLLLFVCICIGCAPSAETLKNEKLALTSRDLGEKYMIEKDYPKAIKELKKAIKFVKGEKK